MDVAAWLQDLKLEQYVSAFHDNDIDASNDCSPVESTIRRLGHEVGPGSKLAIAISATAK